MATPGTFDLDVYRGDSYRWQFNLWADAGKTQPTDLTDVIAKAEIRDKPGGTKVTLIDCTVLLPNTVEIFLSAAKSKAFTITKGSWDLQLTYPSEDVATVIVGSVAITADITDSGNA
jgi:hypothetical protein